MQFASKSKDEIDEQKRNFTPFPVGWYDFEVMHAEETRSKAGNDMIKLNLRVYDPKGAQRYIFDYLLESVATKLFDFCEAVGLADKYTAGALTADDCIGRAARVKLAIEDKDPKYPAKNVVKDYARLTDIGSRVPLPQASSDDDEIPF